MSSPFSRYALVMAGTLLAAMSAGGWAQAPQAAGRFVSVTGEVEVVGRDGTRRNAERGGDIREGDTIVTGAAALAQARMSDGGLISVRADSEFKLEQFGYAGRDDRSASFVVNILKGGFRTITGLIAQVNRSGYRITTPAATIGVRGTHFEVVHVLQQGSPPVPPGTYNRVFEGITTVQNPGGSILQVVREQTAFAALQGGPPQLIAPPAAIFGRPTPVPRAAAPLKDERAGKMADRGLKAGDRRLKAGDRAHKLGDRALKLGDRALKLDERPVIREALPTTPLTPLDSPTTVRSLTPLEPTTTLRSPTTTTISPTISPTLTSPTLTSPTLTSPTLTSPTLTSPTLTSPTTTISPTTTTTISPTTTTISPTTTTILQSPTTTTIKQPTTTTISPTLTR